VSRAPELILALLLAAALPSCRPVGVELDPHDSSQTEDSRPAVSGDLCQPELRLDDPNFVEGDAVQFSFGCGSGASRAAYTVQLEPLPDGAGFHQDSWEMSWNPDYSQGGRYDLLLSVQSVADPGAFPESAVATFWVADALGHPDNIPVDPLSYTEEMGLAVFHLFPSSTPSSSHVPAEIIVYGEAYQAEMKVRGAVSVYYPKQSYTLRFSDEDLDGDPWGMGNKDHLYVVTPFDDNSYVRQKLAYDLWQGMADHWQAERLVPRTFFGVVYLNGQYHGLYLMTDRPDDHFAQEMGLSSDGNLYKSVNHDANFYRTNASGGTKSTLHDGYEKKEGTPAEGEPDAYWDLDQLVAFSADSSDEEFVAAQDDWIRVDEFMDWFLFVHWSSSDDSAGKNAYLYNNPDAFEFRYCPWDFNHSFGQGWYTYRISSEAYSDYTWNNGIFKHHQRHPDTSVELWDRFHAMQNDGPLNEDWMVELMDAYYDQIHPAAERDWSHWGASFSSYWGSSNTNDYEQERAYLYQWLQERHLYMRQVHP